jgi:hypothetical protein
LPSWCQAACDRLRACEVDQGSECDCAGDQCSCEGVEADCEADCEEGLKNYSQSEACAQTGRSFQSCFDSQTCAQLDSGDEPACLPSRAERKACEELPGEDTPPQGNNGEGGTGNIDEPPSAGGYYGTAGSFVGGSGGYGGAGAPSGGAYSGGGEPSGGAYSTGGSSTTGPLVSCTQGSGSGGSGSGGAGAQVTCEETRGDCSDGHTYGWICVDDAAGHAWCSCFFDGNPTNAFTPALTCPSTSELNRACGWNLSDF